MPDGGYTGTVSPFALDAFEVTVRRFRRFVDSYVAQPAAGAGNNPNNGDDSGWNGAWNDLLPPSAQLLREKLSSGECEGTTWTDEPGSNETLPINCVDWYLAQAFCIWDGGRLPTLLEWEYAAGGGEGRIYPWSVPANDANIDASRARYSSLAPEAVGSKPAGRGKWGHYDLAGNVREWLWDGVDICYPENPCNDCGQTTHADKMQRGGDFLGSASEVRVDTRYGNDGTASSRFVGFRCVRDIQ